MSGREDAAPPTEFRGCMWDDGWEFDAPCALYFPFRRYHHGGNTGEIDRLVEDVCFDITEGKRPARGLGDAERREFEWRGWSERGLSRRRLAWHVIIRGKWVKEDGDLAFTPTKRTEVFGPPATAARSTR